MSNPFESETADYLVLVNAEEQYSLWPVSIAVPNGWTAVFGPGKKADCLAYIQANWTDMRPKSLRDQLSESSRN